LSPAKVWIRNSRARGREAEVLQVQNVKGIEKISLDFESTTLAKKELLPKTQIDVAIFWAPE
jgi:hypothetical protein